MPKPRARKIATRLPDNYFRLRRMALDFDTVVLQHQDVIDAYHSLPLIKLGRSGRDKFARRADGTLVTNGDKFRAWFDDLTSKIVRLNKTAAAYERGLLPWEELGVDEEKLAELVMVLRREYENCGTASDKWHGTALLERTTARINRRCATQLSVFHVLDLLITLRKAHVLPWHDYGRYNLTAIFDAAACYARGVPAEELNLDFRQPRAKAKKSAATG